MQEEPNYKVFSLASPTTPSAYSYYVCTSYVSTYLPLLISNIYIYMRESYFPKSLFPGLNQQSNEPPPPPSPRRTELKQLSPPPPPFPSVITKFISQSCGFVTFVIGHTTPRQYNIYAMQLQTEQFHK